jgi:hypothetical protein
MSYRDLDPVVTTHKECYRKRCDHEQDYWHTRVSIDRNNDFILDALDNLPSADVEDLGDESDEERQLE